MTVGKIYNTDFAKDNTEICIRQGDNFHVIARGKWYEDHMLNYLNYEVESFTWQDDNKLYIDVSDED
ncbi:MAG: hypothetical protein HFI48_05875 [Lachnospiraceae bacterium]|nr:hypothetical protein [Lachnospiraceae bacterium]